MWQVLVRLHAAGNGFSVKGTYSTPLLPPQAAAAPAAPTQAPVAKRGEKNLAASAATAAAVTAADASMVPEGMSEDEMLRAAIAASLRPAHRQSSAGECP